MASCKLAATSGKEADHEDCRRHSRSLCLVTPARQAIVAETGKYLDPACLRTCLPAKAAKVIVATDDSRIDAAVRSFGGNVAMTSGDHVCGTDRVAEVARQLDADVVINVQGDEPMIDPASLDLLVPCSSAMRADMATLAVPIRTPEQCRIPTA